MTTPNPLARYQTERELQAQVIRLARLCGWKVMFTWTSVHSPSGWPDLFMTRGSRALAVELKRAGRTPTSNQSAWLAALAQIPGITAVCWTPEHWNEIEATLKGV